MADRNKRKPEGGPASKQPAVKKAHSEAPASAAKSSVVSIMRHIAHTALVGKCHDDDDDQYLHVAELKIETQALSWCTFDWPPSPWFVSHLCMEDSSSVHGRLAALV
jgi:hypothetical protein